MFAFLSSPTARPMLTPEDHALLAFIVEERFTLTHVVANYESAHPARQSLLTLTRWLKLPHIDTALKTLLADLREYESIRHEFLQRHSIDGLVDAMHSASRNLKLLEEARTHNIQHTRAVEELRLAAQALNRATKPGASSSGSTSPRGTPSRGTVPAPRGRAASESHSTHHSSAQRDSDVSHSEGVHVRSRGVESRSDDTPGKITPNISTRSPDALTSDNNSLSTDPASDQCVSASSSPQSGARNEPGASAPGTETSHITLPSSFLSTEGAALSTRSPDALTCDITSSPSTPRHLDTSTPSSSPSTPSSIRPRDRPLQFPVNSPHGGIMIAPGVTVPRHAIDISFTTSSGPGGQNVNKRSTRCVLRMSFIAASLNPGVETRVRAAVPYLVTEAGDLLLDCDEHRSQGQNEDACWERLRAIIVANLKAPKIRRATKPSRGSKERRLTAKKTRGQIKSRRSERHD